MNISRRTFLKRLITSSLLLQHSSAFLIASLNNSQHRLSSPTGLRIDGGLPTIDWSNGIKPIYCTAYIDPSIPSQQGQERDVSRYPLCIVPQDDRTHFKKWRDTVKRLNPDIIMLGYQMVIEETLVPGPGHDILRAVNNSWVTDLSGEVPTVTYPTAPNGKRFRVYDPRKKEWQEAFLEACEKTLLSYPYDGLFLDQCTIYMMASFFRPVRDDMAKALGETLNKLRARFGEKLLIGNSRYNWNALNGEMNENRPNELHREMKDGLHTKPRIELFHYYMKSSDDVSAASSMFEHAINNKAFFATGVNAQTVRWYPFIDKILDGYKII